MRNTFTIAIFLVGTMLFAQPMLAHHGNSAYDLTKTVTLKGTVTDFEFINPHVRFYFDVKDENGNIEHWQAEMGPPTMLAHKGWNSRVLKPGEEITVSGHPGKNGSTSMIPQKIVTSTGEELLKPGGGDQY